jgi:hypothetical protein
MSIYYYLVCDDCKEYCNGASTSGGIGSPLIDANITVWPFMITHVHHNIKIIDDVVDDIEEDCVEWTKDNSEYMKYSVERDCETNIRVINAKKED